MCIILCATCIESYLHRNVVDITVMITMYRQRHNTSIYKLNIYSEISLNTPGVFLLSQFDSCIFMSAIVMTI